MVKVIKNGKVYKLNKEEFRKYMFSLWQKAQASKQAKQDIKNEKGA